MQVAPSGYWRQAAQKRNPALRCARVQRDDVLSVDIDRVWQANMQVYGADKVWRQLRREGTDVARTVERLLRKAGLRGVMRGKVVRTTVPDAKEQCPLDRVNCQFKAQRPNQLRVSDFIYVSTWLGFGYVAFVVASSPGASSAGASAARCGLNSCSTLWNRPCMLVSPNGMNWSTIATGACNTVDKVQRTPGRSRHRTVCGQRGRQLTIMPWPRR